MDSVNYGTMGGGGSKRMSDVLPLDHIMFLKQTESKISMCSNEKLKHFLQKSLNLKEA